MTAANGSKILDEGRRNVRATTTNNVKVNIPFINANVEMPILSVAKLGAEHDAFFGESDGKLTHRRTGQQIPFIKRAGVYFIKGISEPWKY